MKKTIHAKKLMAVLLTVAVLFGTLPVMSVFADSVVTFTAQTTADGFRDNVSLTRSPGTVTMPNVTDSNLKTGNLYGGAPGNAEVSGWLYDGKYYAVGEVVNNVPAGANFTAVYGNKSINFNELSTDFAIYRASGDTYGSVGVSIAEVSEGNNCLQFVGQSGDGDSAKRQGAMVYNSNYAVCYTAGATYKITFRYRRTDTLSVSSDIYVAFGMYLRDWFPESQAIQVNKLVTTKSGMTDFETVTAVVTAPNTYLHGSQNYASKAMGFRVGTPEGVTIQIDDVNVETSLGRERAEFSYGEGNGLTGTNTFEFVDNNGNITLPTNDSAMNLYWSHDGRLFEAGETVSTDLLVKNGSGYYPFTAKFGTVSVDYDEIDTEAFTFATNYGEGSQTGTFFEQLNKSDWWSIPAGYGNDGNKTAFGGSVLGIIKRTGRNETGNYLFLKNWQGGYYNAALFTHTPFDENDPNSHNSSASGSIDYKYVYFTPGETYTLTFDYMLDTTGGGTPPYTVSIAFGMDTKNGNDNCGKKTIEYADGTVARTSVDLGTESKVWKKASITLTAPNGYTGNSITSARVGISVNAFVGTGVYIDNVEFRLEGPVEFSYGDAAGTAAAVGFDTTAHINGDGTVTLPDNENAMNLLWENNGKLYVPGAKVPADNLDGDLSFTAYFGGASFDYENICTGNIVLADGQQNQNLYLSLSRNADYWRLPVGLSNTAASNSGNYGLALGHDRFGIVPGEGNGGGKALSFRTNQNNGPYNLYRSAALFSHNPTTFTQSSSIDYSYVYFTPNTEYTIEFDYKTLSAVSATIAFGVNTSAEFDQDLASTTVNTLGGEGTYITLPATGGTWQHASVTVTSPSSYTGNGVTSARVGIVIKDNEANTGGDPRYNYFDNVEFYPTDGGARYTGHSLVLDDKIGVDFFMDLSKLSAQEKAGSYMTFDITNSTKQKIVAYDSSNTNERGNYHRFTCYVSSVQMAEGIIPTFHYGNGKTITGVPYSVKDYIDYVKENSGTYTENTIALAKALGDYGHYAQIYLNNLHPQTFTTMPKYRASDYSSGDFTSRVSALDAIGTGVTHQKSVSGINSADVTFTLNFDSSTLLKVTVNSASAVSATVNSRPADISRSGNNYYILTPGLLVTQLNTKYTVAGSNASGSFSIENLSALSYVRAILNSGGDANGRQSAMAAFYDYYAAAMVYVS